MPEINAEPYILSDAELAMPDYDLAREAVEDAIQLHQQNQLPESNTFNVLVKYLKDGDSSCITKDTISEAQQLARASSEVDAAFLADALMAVLAAKERDLANVRSAAKRIFNKTRSCNSI